MKKMIITTMLSMVCLLLSFSPGMFLTGKGQTGKTDTVISKKQAEINRQRSLSVYKGIESGDLSAMDEFIAIDIIDHGGMEDVKGRESVKKMLADIKNHFTNLKLTVISEATSMDGTYHFALVRMTGTTKDAYMGMPANTAVDRMGVDVVRIHNDKVVEHWSFDDSRDMMKMMHGKMMDGTKKTDKMDKMKKQ